MPHALPSIDQPADSSLRRSLAFTFLLTALVTSSAGRNEPDDTEIVAISAHAGEDYARTKLPDGTFAPETYAFGEGGLWFSSMYDSSIDALRFRNVARTIAVPLAEKGYIPARDPHQTKLLIMVYWGMTTGTGSPASSLAYQALQATQPISAGSQKITPPPGVSNGAFGLSSRGLGLDSVQTGLLGAQVQSLILIEMENRLRDRANYIKAGILGYNEALAATEGLEMTPMRFRRERLIDELEDSRYFVVLMAYDFQLLWKEKKHRLVWETRYSIRERDNRFDQQLESMTRSASRFFGRNSDGLQRAAIPRGQVELGELQFIGAGAKPEKKP